MKLKYSQKKFIQGNYQKISNHEIATKLGIEVEDVEAHINSNNKLFKNSEKLESIDIFSLQNNNFFTIGLLIALVIIVYINSVNAPFLSDDTSIIAQEKLLSSINYLTNQPMFFFQSLRYFLVYQIGGLTPVLFRIPNIIFHAGFVAMIYIISKLFTKNKNIPFFIAALAAVHPMMVESVTWISGGVYSQSAFITLLAFYSYLRGCKTQNTKWTVLSYIFFAVALSTSEKTIIFPFIIAAYDLSFGTVRVNLKKIAVFFTISFVYGMMLLTIVEDRVDALSAASGLSNGLGFQNPLIQIPSAIGTYLKLFFWPDKLTLYQSEFQLGPAAFSFFLILTISYIIALIYSYKKDKSIFFWLSFFIITLLPTLNPFGLSWIVAERYSYLGSAGLYFVFVTVFFKLFDSQKLKTFGYLIFTIIIFLLSIRTIVRNIDWQTEDNLWIATAKISKSDPKTFNNLGDVYSRQGDIQKASEAFAHAIELNPNYPDAHHNLANAYQKLGRIDEAIKLYKKAIILNPNLWQSYQSLASISYDSKKYKEAVGYIDSAIKIYPNNPQLYVNLGTIYLQLESNSNAKKSFEKALEIEPGNEYAIQGLEAIRR